MRIFIAQFVMLIQNKYVLPKKILLMSGYEFGHSMLFLVSRNIIFVTQTITGVQSNDKRSLGDISLPIFRIYPKWQTPPNSITLKNLSQPISSQNEDILPSKSKQNNRTIIFQLMNHQFTLFLMYVFTFSFVSVCWTSIYKCFITFPCGIHFFCSFW